MDNERYDAWLIQVIGPVYDPQIVFFQTEKKMRFMQTESVLQTKNRSEPAKNRCSVALPQRSHNRHSWLGDLIIDIYASEIS